MTFCEPLGGIFCLGGLPHTPPLLVCLYRERKFLSFARFGQYVLSVPGENFREMSALPTVEQEIGCVSSCVVWILRSVHISLPSGFAWGLHPAIWCPNTLAGMGQSGESAYFLLFEHLRAFL